MAKKGKIIPLNRGRTVRTEGKYKGIVSPEDEFTVDTSSDEENVDPPAGQDDEPEYEPLSDVGEGSSDTLPLEPPPITEGAESIVIHGKRMDGSEERVKGCRKRIVPTSELTLVTAHRAVVTCSDKKTIDILILFLKSLADVATQESDIPSELIEKIKSEASVQQVIFDWTALLVLSRIPKKSSGKYQTDANSFQLMMKHDLEQGSEVIEVSMALWVSAFQMAKEANVEIKKLTKVKHYFQCISLAGGYFLGGVIVVLFLIEVTRGLEHADEEGPMTPVLGILGLLGLAACLGGLYYWKRAESAGGVELNDKEILCQDSEKLRHPQALRFIAHLTEQEFEGKSDGEEESASL